MGGSLIVGMGELGGILTLRYAPLKALSGLTTIRPMLHFLMFMSSTCDRDISIPPQDAKGQAGPWHTSMCTHFSFCRACSSLSSLFSAILAQ